MAKDHSLPSLFLDRINHQLPHEEVAPFLNSMTEAVSESIRVHRHLELIKPYVEDNVPWHPLGYYLQPNTLTGHHPWYHAGAYYAQEASAMAVVPLLEIQPNDVVLDMAAAPGSKATDIASRLGPDGFLIANDVDAKRASVLVHHVERLGLSQVIVTQHDPHHLPTLFPHFFDKILLDAPCSGEGMFRKDPNAIKEWSTDHVTMCAVRQKHLLEEAVRLLKPGGRIVYSTCTFSPDENEALIKRFIHEHADFDVVQPLMSPGFDEKSTGGIGFKLWPHRIRGEGHYVVVLQHRGPSPEKIRFTHRMKNPMPPAWKRFAEATLTNTRIQPNFIYDERVFQIPIRYQFHRALHTLRAGVLFGDIEKNVFYPSHHLAHYLQEKDVKTFLSLSLGDARLIRYMKGEEIETDLPQGWVLVTVNGMSLGWGKASQGRLKNHYPKGLRLTNG